MHSICCLKFLIQTLNFKDLDNEKRWKVGFQILLQFAGQTFRFSRTANSITKVLANLGNEPTKSVRILKLYLLSCFSVLSGRSKLSTVYLT